MISTANVIILFIVIVLIVYFLYINKSRIFNYKSEMEHETNAPTKSNLESDSELDQNGFLKNELKTKELSPSYWYNYAPSEERSKCFACDAEGKYRHPSNCIDCEMKGGRPVDKLLNRVLTR